MVSESTGARLAERLCREQRERRLPSVVAGVVRGGTLAWWGARGAVGPDATATQYRIGSITKTFVAVCVLRLRDEGRLDLLDPVERHLPDAPVGSTTVAQLLSHASGLRAETDAPWWERTAGGDWQRLLASMRPEALRHRPGRRFHYSNVGYAVLGELVQRLRGASWLDVVQAELLGPLGMTRTTPRPVAPAVPGLAVHPWADVVLPEPEHDAGAMAPAGQLWSSLADLARWAAFLGGDTAGIVGPDTLAEMREPLVVDDQPGLPWTGAYGLGVQVWNTFGRRSVGHGGSMPGFVALVRVDVDTADGVVAMTNTTAGFSPELDTDLAGILDEEPRDVDDWTPADVGRDLLQLCGHWYWGPVPMVLQAHAGGGLELRPVSGRGRPSRFRPTAEDTWTGLDGYFAGEPLRVVRGTDGRVAHLDVASFVLTRAPYDADADVPGGVDPDGWR